MLFCSLGENDIGRKVCYSYVITFVVWRNEVNLHPHNLIYRSIHFCESYCISARIMSTLRSEQSGLPACRPLCARSEHQWWRQENAVALFDGLSDWRNLTTRSVDLRYMPRISMLAEHPVACWVLFQYIDTLKAHRAQETGLMSLYDGKRDRHNRA